MLTDVAECGILQELASQRMADGHFSLALVLEFRKFYATLPNENQT